MKKGENEKRAPIPFLSNSTLNSLWVDGINVARRNDEICFVRLLANLPEGVSEQCRFMTTTPHLKEFINALCSSLDYFPKKSEIKMEEKN